MQLYGLLYLRCFTSCDIDTSDRASFVQAEGARLLLVVFGNDFSSSSFLPSYRTSGQYESTENRFRYEISS